MSSTQSHLPTLSPGSRFKEALCRQTSGGPRHCTQAAFKRHSAVRDVVDEPCSFTATASLVASLLLLSVRFTLVGLTTLLIAAAVASTASTEGSRSTPLFKTLSKSTSLVCGVGVYSGLYRKGSPEEVAESKTLFEASLLGGTVGTTIMPTAAAEEMEPSAYFTSPIHRDNIRVRNTHVPKRWTGARMR